MKTQCQAIAPASTYTQSHQCLKRQGVKKSGKRRLCAHHRAKAARAGRRAP